MTVVDYSMNRFLFSVVRVTITTGPVHQECVFLACLRVPV